MTISGTGLSITLISNTVRFNDTAAPVTAATDAALTITVPTAVITGLIDVTVGSTMLTTGLSFTVDNYAADTTTGFSPALRATVTLSDTIFFTGTAYDFFKASDSMGGSIDYGSL